MHRVSLTIFNIFRFFCELIFSLAIFIALPFLALMRSSRRGNEKPALLWGPVAIINNKYWSNALREAGFVSDTMMEEVFPINKKSDYNKYTHELVKRPRNKFVNYFFKVADPYIAFLHSVRNYDIMHFPFSGGYLHSTWLKNLEFSLYHFLGCKILSLPYGADNYVYKDIMDLSLRHALMLSYPRGMLKDRMNRTRIERVMRSTDFMMSGAAPDGIGRWDMLPFNFVCIDEKTWQASSRHNMSNGFDGEVTIIHTPNHRGFKGTEFILKAVEELKQKGLQIRLILLEKKSNEEVKAIMSSEADLLVEQLVFTGYALSGIEGMASGLPVIANLSNEEYTKLYRRYSYLNECPVLSANPENIQEKIELLVTNPELRMQLGAAGRSYVLKYHSYRSAQFMFGKIYDKIWYGKDVDLMNLYHPLKPDSYNNQTAKVQHPLEENNLPANWQYAVKENV